MEHVKYIRQTMPEVKLLFYFLFSIFRFFHHTLFSYYLIIISFAVVFPPQSHCSWRRPMGWNVLFYHSFILQKSWLALLYTSYAVTSLYTIYLHTCMVCTYLNAPTYIILCYVHICTLSLYANSCPCLA